MKKLCEFEALPYVLLKAAMILGDRFHYMGTYYDPKDFAYYGA